MKKLLLSLFAVVATTFASLAQETPAYTCVFNSSTFQSSIQNYTSTWENKCDNKTWTITNFNNNQKGWSYIKCGRNKNASVASITTAFAAPEKIGKVTVTIDAITADKVNSIKLLSSASADFSNVEETVTLSKATGAITAELTHPTENLYYRLVFDCASGSANGFVQVSKIEYYAVQSTPDPDKEETTLTWTPKSNTLAIGDEFTAPTLTRPDDAIVEYASDNSALLSVDPATGEMTFTPGVVGTAKVTAKISDSDPKYFSAAADYTLTVYDPNAPVECYSSALGADFAFNNPAGIEVWKHDAKYGLKGSAYISNKTNAAEAIAASPVIDLTGYHDVTLDFQNAFNNYNINGSNINAADFKGYAYVVAKEESATEWEEICEATAPTAFSWTFFANETVNLDKFAGKKAQFGFKYVSTTECAGTWEIQNIAVKAKVGAPEVKAPVISITASDGQTIVNDEDYTITVGTTLIFNAADAQNITIIDEDNNVNISKDATTLTWTPTAGEYMPTITATNAAGSDEVIFILTVEAEQILLGDIMANSKVLADDDEFEVEIGTPVIFSAEHAEKISYQIADTDYSDEKSASTIIWDTTDVPAGDYIATITAELGSEKKDVTVWISVVAPKQEATLTFSQSAVTIAEDEEFTPPTLTTDPEGLEVTYSSSNADVATIVNNEVTLTGTPGTTVITATFAGNDHYYPASATYTLTVTEKVIPGSDVYELVTSTDQLVAGAKYVIVSKPFKSGTVQYGTYAIGAAKSTNKGFDAVKIDPEATTVPDTYDLSSISGYSVLTLEASATANSWYLAIDGKYLDGTTKSSLKMVNDAKDITISIDNNGNAIMTTGKDGTKDVTIQFYAQNSGGACANEAFNAYSSTQKPVALYKQKSESALPSTPSISVDNDDFGGEETTISLEGKEKVVIELKHEDSDNHSIFHKFVANNGPHNAPALQADDNDGFIEYTEPIEIKEAGTLHYYAQHKATGVKSETRTIIFTGSTTSITEITATEGDTEWYDLSGRRVAKPTKGIYVTGNGQKVIF